jgi:hypothetical protein
VIAVAFFWAAMGRNLFGIARSRDFRYLLATGRRRRGAALTERSQDIQDADLRNLLRLISACTLGLWAFAAGILIGTFLFS